MTEDELLRQHLEVLFDTDTEGRLVRVNESDGDPPPRLFLARGRACHLLGVRQDVPADAETACRRLAAGMPVWDGRPSEATLFEPLRTAVAAHDVTIGPAFRFPEASAEPSPATAEAILIDDANVQLLEGHFPYTRANLGQRSPVVGIVVDGAIVAACYSASFRSFQSTGSARRHSPRARRAASVSAGSERVV